MQTSIKINNPVLGETTFSGGISTTEDQRLGFTGGNGSNNNPYKYIPADRSSGLTNQEVFELTKNYIIVIGNSYYLCKSSFNHTDSRIVFYVCKINDRSYTWYSGLNPDDLFYLDGGE